MMRHMSMSLCGFSAIAGSKLKMSNDQLVHIVSFFEFSDFLKHATFHLVPKVVYTLEYNTLHYGRALWQKYFRLRHILILLGV